MIRTLFLLFFLPLSGLLAQNKPNLIYILADDLGYGDLGCYGQKIVKTPHLDQMAREGLRFTQHYSGSTVCAPTRSCLMTGLHTGHTSCRGNIPGSLQAILPTDLTIATHLKKAGYRTGMIGKWGLGLEGSPTEPNKMGFDFFYGYLSQITAHSYYPRFVYRNRTPEYFEGNNQRTEEGRLTYIQDKLAEEAIEYLTRHAKKKEPFFLYLPFLIPHASIDSPEKDYQSYVGKIEEAKPWGRPNQGGYRYQPRPHAAFAGMVSRLDSDVGRVLQQLRKLGIANNTLVVFSSDNGPHLEGGADPDFFDSNGPLTGYKRSMTEGGIRVPTIAWWPGTIEAGRTTDHISAHWDMFPTFSELAGLRTPKDLDGISMVSTLHGLEKKQTAHDHLYWEFGERGGSQAIRKGPWKAIRQNLKKNPEAPIQLFHLEKDLAETNNVAKEHPKVVAEMKKLFQTSRTKPLPTYPLLPSDYPAKPDPIKKAPQPKNAPAAAERKDLPLPEIKMPDKENRIDLSFGTDPLILDLDTWGGGVAVTKETYKRTPQGDLRMVVFRPKEKGASPRPAVVFYYGGGWKSGSVSHFYQQAAHLASKGVVCFLPEYRIESLHKTTPFESVMDARDAFRHVQSKAEAYEIDLNRIAAAGGSAGGHVAASTHFLQIDDPATKGKRTPLKPAALLLYNPVIDTSSRGYGYERLGKRWKEISPLAHVTKGAPPTFIVHGTGDRIVPFAGAQAFADTMKAKGNNCTFHPHKDQDHGYFNYSRGDRYFTEIWQGSIDFLDQLGWFEEGKPDAKWLTTRLKEAGG